MDRALTYQQTLLEEVRELPEEAFPNLLRIVRLFKESVLLQSQRATLTHLTLRDELIQWDKLSDEALVNFEKGL